MTVPVEQLVRSHPGRLRSLFEMLESYGAKFAHFMDKIGDLRTIDRREHTKHLASARLGLSSVSIADSFDRFLSDLEEWPVPLTAALAQIKHIRDRFGPRAKPFAEADFHDEVERLKKEFQSDLDKLKFYFVRPDLVGMYERYHPWGETVFNSFWSATRDIEEAGTCLALGRSTACVMHLMRVLEVTLVALADAVGAPTNKPGWETIINTTRNRLKNMSEKTHGPDWRKLNRIYSEALADLLQAKDAWRNHVMHLPVFYDERQAFKIYENVQDFVEKLAPYLCEKR